MSNYKLFDITNNELQQGDLQDKSWWCEDGRDKEFAFVDRYGDRLGLQIHPDKATDPYGPDMLHVSGRPADLKTQNTPFFLARTKFNLDPRLAVTFNVKDAIRYTDNYPDILVYFAVDWVAVKMVIGDITRTVEPLSGVWAARFSHLEELFEAAPTHKYQQRIGDDAGNAQDSIVFSLADFGRVI